MSVRFYCTAKDDIGKELTQYIYGKYGVAPPKAILQMLLAAMSKNPLTPQQAARIVREYGDDAIPSLIALSGSAESKTNGGQP